MSRTDFNQLLEAGAHFGHLKRKWNPKMAPYISDIRQLFFCECVDSFSRLI